MRRRWVGLAFALLAMVAMAGSTAGARAEDDGDAWARLGPPGPQRIGQVAVAPGWPEDRLILAARGGALIRSRDGGATWEVAESRVLTPPDVGLSSLALAPSFGSVRPAFALAERRDREGAWSVYRSTDAGDSWEEVLALPTRPRPELVLSPDFAQDGLALVVADGRLHRSRDAGGTWEELDPLLGASGPRRVQQALFSPDFGRDRTLYLAVVSGGFPSVVSDRPADQPSTDHELSVGVLQSTDGGESWALASGGLEVDGVAYRHVQRLAVSPTHAEDGTLFAFAWGPREPGEPTGDRRTRTWSGGLFRSRDRGASWAPVRVFERSISYPQGVELALSPTFAADGVALLGVSSSYVSPASSGCRVDRTGDGGESWDVVLARGSYEGCRALHLVGAEGQLTALVDKMGWRASTDGGLTWQGLGLPEGSAQVVVPSPAHARDRTLFVGASFGGIWAFGPSVGSTDGRLPCPSGLVGGFGRVWESEAELRGRLGCPLEAERAVRIRERQLAESRGYWIEDEGAEWFELFERTSRFWSSRSKAERPWPDPPDRVLDGAAQRFEGGTMLFLPRSEDNRTILVLLGSGGDWRELPD